MARRRPLVEVLEETKAIHSVRNVAKARVSRAKREALAPTPPSAAVALYGGVMDTYAKRVAALVERHVVGALPVVGSGDPLDRAALELGLRTLEEKLAALATRIRPSARAAATRTSQHARREIGRLMKLDVPNDASAKFAISAFEDIQVERLRKVGRDQVAKIREAIAKYEEGDSMRADITHTLWVSRNRGQLIARHDCHQLHQQTIREWALHAGSTHFVYCTRRDEQVRKTHAAHDGKVYRYSETPKEMGEVNCRCRQLPVEATYDL